MKCCFFLVWEFSNSSTSRVKAPVFISIKVYVSTNAWPRHEGMSQDSSFAIKRWAVLMVCKECVQPLCSVNPSCHVSVSGSYNASWLRRSGLFSAHRHCGRRWQCQPLSCSACEISLVQRWTRASMPLWRLCEPPRLGWGGCSQQSWRIKIGFYYLMNLYLSETFNAFCLSVFFLAVTVQGEE